MDYQLSRTEMKMSQLSQQISWRKKSPTNLARNVGV